MTIRKMVMAQMAGSNVIKGTFTAPTGQSSYTLNFGKTLSKYLFTIEMTDASKTALLASGQSSAKMFACEGMYPVPSINSNNIDYCMLSYRVVPSTGVVSYSATAITGIDGSSITFYNNTYGSGTNVLYQGSSYNYSIIPID